MKKLMFLTMVFGLMMVFSGSVLAQNKGNGFVITVNNDNPPNTKEFLAKSGDQVLAYFWKAPAGFEKMGLAKDHTYTRIEVRQPRRIMYIYYAADHPKTQDQINNGTKGRTTNVSNACSNSKPWKPGDKITIQTQAAQGGGTDVTFSNEGKGCFSFIAK